MTMSQDTQKHIRSLATETLDTFDKVSTDADSELASPPYDPRNVLAKPTREGVRELDRLTEDRTASFRHLSQEPAIARVVALKDGAPHTYFICRCASFTSATSTLVSYGAPVGRLASLTVGDDLTLPNGDVLELVEKAAFRPIRGVEGWDSRDSTIYHFSRTFSVKSLRAFLPAIVEEPVDVVQQQLDEEAQSDNITEGIRRAVLTQMALRDQPILDKFQDSIFRLPLDSCLLLLGPPGTGKTTTLIRRLGQKLSDQLLTEDEKQLVQEDRHPNETAHRSSWLMFTPTALLHQYIKEAFSREGIPASDRHVRVWSDFRLELARNTLGLLRTPHNRSGFVMQGSMYPSIG